MTTQANVSNRSNLIDDGDFPISEFKRNRRSYTTICSTWHHEAMAQHFKQQMDKRARATEDTYLKSFVAQFYGGSPAKFAEVKKYSDLGDFFAENLLPFYFLKPEFKSRVAVKRRFSRDLIREYFPFEKGNHILEIGSAFGITTYDLLKCGFKVTSLEPSGFASSVALKALTKAGVVNSTNLSFHRSGIPDGLKDFKVESFDAVLAPNVLEHVPDPDYLVSLRPIWDLLKPGGSFCIVAPDGNQDYHNIEKNADYARELAKATHFAVKSLAYYTTTCVAAGFKIEKALFAGKRTYPRIVILARKSMVAEADEVPRNLAADNWHRVPQWSGNEPN